MCGKYNVKDIGVSTDFAECQAVDSYINRINIFAAKAKNAGFTFSYHNHDYSLKFNKETNQKLVYSNGRLIGEILEDGDETIVVINDEEKDYVSNTKSTNRTYLEVIKKYEDKTKAKENKDDFER